MNHPRTFPSRHAFTLVEFLIILAICCALGALLFNLSKSAKAERQREAEKEARRDLKNADNYRIVTDGVQFRFVWPDGETNAYRSFETCDEAHAGIQETAWSIGHPAPVKPRPPLTGFTNAVCK